MMTRGRRKQLSKSKQPRAKSSVSEHSARGGLLGAAVALFVARPFYPSESTDMTGDGLIVVMLWIVLAVAWTVAAIRWPTRVRFGAVDLAVMALLAWQTVAGVVAVRLASPRPAVNVLWEWIGLWLGFLLIRQLVRTRREARAVIVVMIGVAVALSMVGLYQYFVELPTTRAVYAENPDQALRAAGLWYEPGSPAREQFEQRLASTEPPGTFALANSLAGLLAPWLVIAVGIAARSTRATACLQAVSRSRAVTALLPTIPVSACLLLTKSRSALVAVAFGTVLVLLVAYRSARGGRMAWKWPLAGIGVIALLVGSVTAVGGLDRQVFSEASKSLGYRLQYWQATGAMIAESPFLGCGPGQFQNAYVAHKLPEASEEIADPHNFLLEIAATAGIPAAAAMLAALGLFATACVAGFARGPSENQPADQSRAVLIGAAAGLFLAVPLGLVCSAPPGWIVLATFPVAILTVALLSGWVREGTIDARLPAIGVAVLAVNLLAAGGISFAGVAGSFWLLFALGLVLSEHGRARPLHRGLAFGGVVLVLAAGVSCYVSAYGPVLPAQAALSAAARGDGHRLEHLAAAARSDPLDATPWRRLADVFVRRWEESGDEDTLVVMANCLDSARRLDPHSASQADQAGTLWNRVHRRSNNRDHLDRAIVARRRAVDLYPNNATYWARLAATLSQTGEPSAGQAEARRALELDRITPHADKKIPESLRAVVAPLVRG